MHSKYIKVKRRFDWDADFRLWVTAPSCLSHQSLNLVTWTLLIFGPFIHLYEMHTTCFFVGWGSNVSEEGLLGLAWRVNGSDWPSFDQIDSCNWKSFFSKTNLEWNKLLIVTMDFHPKNLRLMESGWQQIAPHHEKSLEALETTPSARVVPWLWQVVKYIVNPCICEGILF